MPQAKRPRNRPPRHVSSVATVVLGLTAIAAITFAVVAWISTSGGTSGGSPTSAGTQAPAGSGTPSGCADGCQSKSLGGGGRQLVTTVGIVTAISANSISVRPSGGVAKTFSITSSTQIFEGANTISLSEIHTGDRVLVGVSDAGSTQAVDVVLNPN